MASAKIESYYRRHAVIYDLTRSLLLHGRQEAVSRLGLSSRSRVLEVGCGTGLNLELMEQRMDPSEGSVCGLDLSPEMLRKARRRAKRRGWSNLTLLQGDASRELPLGPFDAILFSYSLAMIEEWEEALELACAALAPGGRLVVLEFGDFDRWGLLRAPLLAWLRRHGVKSSREPLALLERKLRDFELLQRLGGYYLIAAGLGRRP